MMFKRMEGSETVRVSSNDEPGCSQVVEASAPDSAYDERCKKPLPGLANQDSVTPGVKLTSEQTEGGQCQWHGEQGRCHHGFESHTRHLIGPHTLGRQKNEAHDSAPTLSSVHISDVITWGVWVIVLILNYILYWR